MESVYNFQITNFNSLAVGDLADDAKTEQSNLESFFEDVIPEDTKPELPRQKNETKKPKRSLVVIFIIFILLLLLISLFP